jgi:hypothetical protein
VRNARAKSDVKQQNVEITITVGEAKEIYKFGPRRKEKEKASTPRDVAGRRDILVLQPHKKKKGEERTIEGHHPKSTE